MAKFDMLTSVRGLRMGRRIPAFPKDYFNIDYDKLTQKILADPNFDPSSYLHEAFKRLIISRLKTDSSNDSLDEAIVAHTKLL